MIRIIPQPRNNECKASKLNKLKPQAAISCTSLFPPSVILQLLQPKEYTKQQQQSAPHVSPREHP